MSLAASSPLSLAFMAIDKPGNTKVVQPCPRGRDNAAPRLLSTGGGRSGPPGQHDCHELGLPLARSLPMVTGWQGHNSVKPPISGNIDSQTDQASLSWVSTVVVDVMFSTKDEGCKGNGKSHTGNTILGQEAFRVTRKGGTEKSSLCSSSHEVDGVSRKVTVVDTPGVSQEMTESEFEELVRAVKMVPEGFDAICLVWDYENSEKNEDKEVQVFQSLHRLFGDKLYKHLVILVTHAQQEDIPEFLDELPEAMKEITKQCHATEFVKI
ncbi:hypothetical protein Bbelb_326590 [Branchiostoma belcheri]|nr:hypothetical protein Bbelb_326590 [Branchiostoma belcheri]